jgi:hypothetical protein
MYTYDLRLQLRDTYGGWSICHCDVDDNVDWVENERTIRPEVWK